MLFDQTNPSSAYWTPPKLASGGAKTRLALFGYKADGSQNTWGKISSWIPGANLMTNISAQQVARGEGLTDVANNVAADTDNRLQKLSTLMSVGKTVAGAITANPDMIQSGIQGVTQGVSGAIQAGSDDDVRRLTGNVSYGRYAEGGKPKRPRTAEAAAEQGANFVGNWFRGRAKAGLGGLEPADAGRMGSMPPPIVSTAPTAFGQDDSILADIVPRQTAYWPQSGATFIRPTADTNRMAENAVAVTTEAVQDSMPERLAGENDEVEGIHLDKKKLGNWGRALGILDDPLKDTYSRIDSAVQKANKPTGALVNKASTDAGIKNPQAIHQKLMQVRYNGGLKPTETVTPERFRDAVLANPQNESTLRSLRQVLSDQQIHELLNTTASNYDATQDDGSFRAAEGGRIYPKHDKTTEDILMLDKKTGEKVGEMRYNERIFDQHATMKLEELADKGDATALGKFLMAELATHPDRSAQAQYFAGGGKPKPRPSTLPPSVYGQGMRFGQGSMPGYGSYGSLPGVPIPSVTGTGRANTPARSGARRTSSAGAGNPGRDAIRAEQRELAAAGLYTGAIDGIAGPKTLSARQQMSAYKNRGAANADPITSNLAINPDNDGASGKPVTGTIGAPVTGFTGAKMDNTADAGGTKTDWWGLGSDALRGITAAIGAAQPLPERPVNPNLLQMQRELADRRNEGLSAGDRVNLLRSKAATQQANINAIRDTVGGGGSANAVLAAINQADSQANVAGLGIEEADRKQRMVNRDAYYGDLVNSQQGSDAIYQQQYNQALNSKNAFAQAMMANLQNAADRQQYDKAYGQGSPYYTLMSEMMKRTGKAQAYADAPVTSLLPATK
jgi:hypothetical protein